MYDNAFDGEVGETIEAMIVHDEDQDISISKKYPNIYQKLSYERICELINESEKLKRKSFINYNNKQRLVRDIVLIILMVIIYVLTNPFANDELYDQVWKTILYFIICTISFIGFFISIRVLKKDWRIFILYKDKKWYEENHKLFNKEVD